MWKNNDLDDQKLTGVSEHTGFPNAGTDSSLSSLDLAKLLIQNPSSTFFMRLRGDQWQDRGVYDGDVVVIDRALVAKPTDLVIWWGGEAFAIGKPLHVPKDTEVWGVVTTIIHQTRSKV
jgi:SOS-response transcriptional repressor LexA